MPTFASTFIPTGGATATRNADVLPFPFLPRPQVMTGYFRFINLGIHLMDGRVLHIGTVNSNAAPRLEVFHSGIGWAIFFDNGITVGLTSTANTTDAVNDEVELLWSMSASGVLNIDAILNGAAAVSGVATAGAVLPTKWASPSMTIGKFTTVHAFMGLRNFDIHRGVQSLETMRRLAGV